MHHIILFEPEIPQNTGNIIRLCANTGAHLHLIEPLGFVFNSTKMRRAGLDYLEFAAVKIHPSWEAFRKLYPDLTLYALTTKGKTSYASPRFGENDAFVFGPETRGLPAAILAEFPEEKKLRLPMRPESRSMNLANTVAVMVFEAWRQNDFTGGV